MQLHVDDNSNESAPLAFQMIVLLPLVDILCYMSMLIPTPAHPIATFGKVVGAFPWVDFNAHLHEGQKDG